jgi:hypothetical protein
MSSICSLISNRISMATNSRLNSVAFPETRAVGEEGVVVVGVTGGVAETMVETAEAVGGEGADHPETVECHHPVIEVAVIMTVTATTTVVVDTVVLRRLVASLLPLVDFIQVPPMAMGTILLTLTVLMGVLMDPLLGGPVDLAPLLLVEVAVATVDPLVDLVPLELASLNLPILYLHKAHHQTVDLVAPDQTVVVPRAPLVLPQEAWVLLEKDIQVVPHLPAPLHLGEIWAMDDGLQIWGDLPLREMVPATIEVVLQAAVSF